MSSPHLQRELGILVNESCVDKLLKSLAGDDEKGHRRLAELLDPGVCHDWLWKSDPRKGSRLADEDFVLNLQARLGAEIAPEDAMCRLCGEPLDSSAAHSMCCAKGESTKGHYAVVSALLDGIATVDPSARTEVQGLVSTPERPADILTEVAIPGKLAALDICIAAQDACAAGPDACASAYRRKTTHYRHLLPELRRAGVVFQPMVWSAEGRPHPAATRVMDCVTRRVRARKGSDVASEFAPCGGTR